MCTKIVMQQITLVEFTFFRARLVVYVFSANTPAIGGTNFDNKNRPDIHPALPVRWLKGLS